MTSTSTDKRIRDDDDDNDDYDDFEKKPKRSKPMPSIILQVKKDTTPAFKEMLDALYPSTPSIKESALKESKKQLAFAKLNNCPISARKMRLVADLLLCT